MAGKSTEYIPPQFRSTRQFCMGGLITKEDPQDLMDTEGKFLSQSPDLRNVIYDNGYIQPRYGSSLVLAAPAGETGNPQQLIVTHTSDGLQYLIAVFSTGNFYLFEPTTPQWLNITGSVISTVGKTFGSISWNGGITADVLYLGNGYDDTIKWSQFLSKTTVTAGAGDTTLTLADTTHLPSSGKVVLYVNGTPTSFTFTANSNNVLSLSAPVGSVIASGTFVSTQMAVNTNVPKGKIFARYNGRLVVANALGNENQINISQAGYPENFTTGTGAGDALETFVTDGNGGLTDVITFGQFLLVCKQDSLNEFSINISSDLTLQSTEIQPLIVGTSVGPISRLMDIQYDNALYFPSEQNGIYELIPSTTGSNASTKVNPISQQIYNTLIQPNFSFKYGRGISFQRKLMWLASTLPNQAANDVIVVYDLERENWSIWDNWNAADICCYKKTGSSQSQLYFISQDDSALYMYDQTTYSDYRGGQPIAYTPYAYSKRWDYNLPDNNKDGSLIHLTGYIDLSTQMLVDVLVGTGAGIALITYLVDGSNTDYVKQVLSYGVGFKPIGNAGIGGVVPYKIGIFDVYLDLPVGYKWKTIQVRPYSQNIGANWGVTGAAVNPQVVETIPPTLRISPL